MLEGASQQENMLGGAHGANKVWDGLLWGEGGAYGGGTVAVLKMAKGVLEQACLKKSASVGCVLARPGGVSVLHWLLQVSWI